MMWQPSFSMCLEFVSRNRFSEHQIIRKTRFWFQFFNFHQRSPVMDWQFVQGPMSAWIASSPPRPCKRMNGWMDLHQSACASRIHQIIPRLCLQEQFSSQRIVLYGQTVWQTLVISSLWFWTDCGAHSVNAALKGITEILQAFTQRCRLAS